MLKIMEYIAKIAFKRLAMTKSGGISGLSTAVLPLALLLAACGQAGSDDPAVPHWSKDQITSLRLWVKDAPLDALPLLSTGDLDAAGAKWGNGLEARRAATALAEKLATAHLRGCAAPEERVSWFMNDDADSAVLRGYLRQALDGGGNLDSFYDALRPASPDYAALRAAYLTETDPARRTLIARNMERWRWMPQHLGPDHVLANVPAFEVGLWRGGALTQSWPVVVGKTATPTPSLNARIKAVTFNPWWDLPRSIIEGQRGFSARHGYVTTRGGHVRQKPGPGNALGEMKIEMPNPYAIYLHDTPSKSLFAASYRAYSHGCVRVKDALGFAAAVLGGSKTRDDIDYLLGYRKVADLPGGQDLISRPGDSQLTPDGKKIRIGEIRANTVRLPQEIPVYIAYFTASANPDGSLRFDKDLYHRDPMIGDPANPHRACGISSAPHRSVLRYEVEDEAPGPGDLGP
jgi:hypothetical protein